MKRRLALLAALSAADVLAGNAPPLFTEILDASQPTPPRTQAVYPVIVNFTPLDSGTDNLELVLPGSAGGTYTALRVRFEQRPGGGYHWIGKTGTHDVILTVDGSLITGFIRGGGETYSVISGVAGGSTSHALMRMDAESFPSDYVEGEAQVAKSVVVEKGALPEFPEAQCFG